MEIKVGGLARKALEGSTSVNSEKEERRRKKEIVKQ
jgi:ribosome-associated protein YbcJ (S4-like RNA binding protein)